MVAGLQHCIIGYASHAFVLEGGTIEVSRVILVVAKKHNQVRCMMFLLNRQWMYSIHQNWFLYWKMVWQTCIAEAINALPKKFGENSVKRNNEDLMNMRSLELQFHLSNYVISR